MPKNLNRAEQSVKSTLELTSKTSLRMFLRLAAQSLSFRDSPIFTSTMVRLSSIFRFLPQIRPQSKKYCSNTTIF
jgi:hypothetical protein